MFDIVRTKNSPIAKSLYALAPVDLNGDTWEEYFQELSDDVSSDHLVVAEYEEYLASAEHLLWLQTEASEWDFEDVEFEVLFGEDNLRRAKKNLVNKWAQTHLINFTQHIGTEDQVNDGLIDLNEDVRKYIQGLLTFSELPSQANIKARANALAKTAQQLCQLAGTKRVLIGGAPFLMAALEQALKDIGLVPVYAFSKRIAEEKTLPDGSVIKTSRFSHEGWIE